MFKELKKLLEDFYDNAEQTLNSSIFLSPGIFVAVHMSRIVYTPREHIANCIYLNDREVTIKNNQYSEECEELGSLSNDASSD